MKSSVLITAIICISLIEVCALMNGINGTLLTIVVGVIAAIAGIAIPTPKFLKGGN